MACTSRRSRKRSSATSDPILMVLTAAVGLLLLIACVNVGNLLLLRAASRARELSIRRALGATYGDVVRQLVVESGLLGVAGGVLGLVTAGALIRLLLAYAPPQLPRTDVVGIAGTPIALAVGVTLAAVLVFGCSPCAARLERPARVATPLRLPRRDGDARATSRQAGARRVAGRARAGHARRRSAPRPQPRAAARPLARLQPRSAVAARDRVSAERLQRLRRQVRSARANALADQLVPAYRAVPGVTAVTPALVPPFLGTGIFVGRLDLEGQTAEETKKNPVYPLEAGGGGLLPRSRHPHSPGSCVHRRGRRQVGARGGRERGGSEAYLA